MLRGLLPIGMAIAGLALAAGTLRADEADDQFAVAAGHYAAGRWELAAEEFQNYLEQFPQGSRIGQTRFFLGEALVQLGRHADAQAQFKQLLQDLPEHRFARQARFRLGETAYLQSQWDLARSALEEFQRRHADDRLAAYALYYLGDVALRQERFAEAKTYFEQCLARFPDGPRQTHARWGLARSLQSQGQHAPAAELLRDLAAQPKSALADDAAFALGVGFNQAGQYQQAADTFAAFEANFADSPLVPRARLARAWALFRLKDYDQARRLLETLADHADLGADARYWLGMTFYARGDWQQAADMLGPLVEDQAGAAHAEAVLYHLGDALRRLGQRPQAETHLQRLLEQWPDGNWADDAALARLLAAVDADDDAAVQRWADFQARFAASPLLPDAHQAQARWLIGRQKFAEAVALLKPLVADPQRATPTQRYLLGIAYQGVGQPQEALQALEPLAADADSDLAADVALARASALVALERFAEALPLLERVERQDPQSQTATQALAQRAMCLVRLKEYSQAQAALDELVARESAGNLRWETFRRAADAALAQSEPAQAAAWYARLSKDGPADEVPWGWLGEARALAQQQQAVPAVELLERLLRDAPPQHPAVPEAALLCGQLHQRQSALDRALTRYQAVLENPQAKPLWPQAMLHSAAVYDRLNRDGEAVRLYQQLADDFPDFPQRDQALYRWAWALHDLGQPEQGRAVFERLRKEHHDSPLAADATYRLARAAFEADQMPRARSLLEELLAGGDRIDPLVAGHARLLLSQVAAAGDQWAEVRRLLEPLLANGTDAALRDLAGYWIAESHYQDRQWDEALSRFATLVAQSPRDAAWRPMALLRQGQLLVRRKEWGEAQRVLETIARDHPQFPQQYEADYLLGRCLTALGQLDDAREAFRRVVRSEQGNKTETAARAQWMIGETYFHQKDYAAAQRELLRVEILYDYPQWQAAALLDAGKCCENLGQWDEAVKIYQRLIDQYGQTKYRTEAEQRLAAARQRAGGATNSDKETGP